MKKVYMYNPNDDVKNIFLTEVEVGPHDIVDNSTEVPPLEPVEGFFVVFDESTNKWIYRVNLRKKFYNPEDGTVIDNELNPEYAKHTLEDFGVKSIDELVTVPPPEPPQEKPDEIPKSYYWNYQDSKWYLNTEKYKEEALSRLDSEYGSKLEALSSGVAESEKETFMIQFEEAKKYLAATPEEKDTEVEIKVLVPNLYALVKSRFDLDDDFDEFKEYLEDKIAKIIKKHEAYNLKSMEVTGVFQAYKDKMSKLKSPTAILDLFMEYKNL